MDMTDGVRATRELRSADRARCGYANAYNIQGLSATPTALAAVLTQRLLHGHITAEIPAYRQALADSWLHACDDSATRVDG
jgi:hypothetical protein